MSTPKTPSIVARLLADKIKKNAEDFFFGNKSHEDFSKKAVALWTEVEAADLVAEVRPLTTPPMPGVPAHIVTEVQKKAPYGKRQALATFGIFTLFVEYRSFHVRGKRDSYEDAPAYYVSNGGAMTDKHRTATEAILASFRMGPPMNPEGVGRFYDELDARHGYSGD